MDVILPTSIISHFSWLYWYYFAEIIDTFNFIIFSLKLRHLSGDIILEITSMFRHSLLLRNCKLILPFFTIKWKLFVWFHCLFQRNNSQFCRMIITICVETINLCMNGLGEINYTFKVWCLSREYENANPIFSK